MKAFLCMVLGLLFWVTVDDWAQAESPAVPQKEVPVLRDSKQKPDPLYFTDHQEFMAMQEAYGSFPEGLVASSTKKSQGSNRYGAAQMGDLDSKTAWVEGHSNYGLGESVSFTWREKNHFHTCAALSLMNGYQKSKGLMESNSRVKDIDLYADGELKARLALQDRLGYQTFGLDGLGLRDGQRIKLVIRDVYKGTKWQDTCISELIVQCVP